MNTKTIVLSALLLLMTASCFKSRDTKYLLFEEPAEQVEADSRVYALKSFLQVASIDILFVVDNSGSMGSIQENVAKNASLFMRQFALNSAIDWKIGIVSTDEDEPPYLGFEESFDASLIIKNDTSSFDRVVNMFADGIDSLGTVGHYEEYIFYNTKRHIREWDGTTDGRQSFLRENAHLVVIMITDEEEQSLSKGSQFKVDNMISDLSAQLSSTSVLRFYGALNMGDLTGCNSVAEYVGSPFEDIINQTNGFVISACLDDFGNQLARIGEDIATLIKVPRLALRNRPKVDTITIVYNGKVLKAGRPENGGVWYYDYETNTINFYTIDFVENIETDTFDITFEVEDGIDRA